MLAFLRLLGQRGTGKDPREYFELMRAMLFCIDEFPEHQHYPEETERLLPRMAARSAESDWPGRSMGVCGDGPSFRERDGERLAAAVL